MSGVRARMMVNLAQKKYSDNIEPSALAKCDLSNIPILFKDYSINHDMNDHIIAEEGLINTEHNVLSIQNYTVIDSQHADIILDSTEPTIYVLCTSNNQPIDVNNPPVINTCDVIDTAAAISDESNDMIYNNSLVPYSEHSDSDDGATVTETHINRIKRRQRCQVDSRLWADQMNSKNREKGKNYFGGKKEGTEWKKISKSQRKMKLRCKCGISKSMKCGQVTDQQRQDIFDAFWLMTWGEKKVFIDGLVTTVQTKRPRDRKDQSISKRNCSMLYHLKVHDNLIRVCKTMFLNTLDIGKASVWKWKTESKEHLENSSNLNENTTISRSENKIRKNSFEKEVKALEIFLNTIPKMPSHYCRQSTSREYLLPEWDSKTSLYKFYVSNWCVTNNTKPISIAKFNNVLNILNISLFRPKKDECSICLAHKLQQKADDEYEAHIQRKKEAREEKENDKAKEKFVFTVDLQAVLTAPKSNVSSLYYKMKLCVHNYCLYNLNSHEGHCYMWTETEGGLNAEEFTTLLVHFLINKMIPNVNDNQIIIYSDGCTYQNRNVTMSNALLNVAMTKKVVIEQKYLEVGHTQMEADSMHSAIERKLKHKIINVPYDYVTVCKEARKNPYDITYLDYTFFFKFDDIRFFKSIRPGKGKGDPKVTDTRALQYNIDGTVNYKLKFTDDWKLLPQRRSAINEPKMFETLPNLYSERLKITSRKYNDLQDLKLAIPIDYHEYYNNIPHE